MLKGFKCTKGRNGHEKIASRELNKHRFAVNRSRCKKQLDNFSILNISNYRQFSLDLIWQFWDDITCITHPKRNHACRILFSCRVKQTCDQLPRDWNYAKLNNYILLYDIYQFDIVFCNFCVSIVCVFNFIYVKGFLTYSM